MRNVPLRSLSFHPALSGPFSALSPGLGPSQTGSKSHPYLACHPMQQWLNMDAHKSMRDSHIFLHSISCCGWCSTVWWFHDACFIYFYPDFNVMYTDHHPQHFRGGTSITKQFMFSCHEHFSFESARGDSSAPHQRSTLRTWNLGRSVAWESKRWHLPTTNPSRDHYFNFRWYSKQWGVTMGQGPTWGWQLVSPWRNGNSVGDLSASEMLLTFLEAGRLSPPLNISGDIPQLLRLFGHLLRDAGL